MNEMNENFDEFDKYVMGFDFNEIFINDYGFEILEKKIKFREIKDGDFFKYQLISMNTIWQINNIVV